MADLDFIASYPDEHATIIVLLPDGTAERITGLCSWVIADNCPLLGQVLDDGPSNGHPQASIEASSKAAVTSFLRYLYTGSYLTSEEQDSACSLLRHAEVYKLARDYNVPELQTQAYLRFLMDIEYSCSFPNPPLELCEAIRFIYNHLAGEQQLIDNLVNYTVSSFHYHGLGKDEGFRQVAYDIPEFHTALGQTSLSRDFLDEGASEIIRLPVCRVNPPSVALLDAYAELQTEKRTQAEFQFTDWYDSEHTETDSVATAPPPKRRKTRTDGDFTLVHRPKQTALLPAASESEQSSDEDGFTAVLRPKITDRHTAAFYSSASSTAADESDVGWDAEDDVSTSSGDTFTAYNDSDGASEFVIASAGSVSPDQELVSPTSTFQVPEFALDPFLDFVDSGSGSEWSLLS